MALNLGTQSAEVERGTMRSLKGQLSVRGIIIGCIGCVIITTASMYTALKLGALPWPILFAAIISLFFLKALGRRKRTNFHEINVTHTIMSSGAMVAGGLAFTIPGIWILGYADGVSWIQMLVVAFAGVILGLICTVYLRRHFVETADLEYPLGEATAQTLLASDAGGKVGRKLFGSLGFAGVYALARDLFGVVPTMLFSGVPLPSVIQFGLYNSPMMLAIGFIVGTAAIVAWIIGAVIGNFGVVLGGNAAGLWDLEFGRQIANSLGMGLMMGSGVAVVFKVLVPTVRNFVAGVRQKDAPEASKVGGSSTSGKAGGSERFAKASASGKTSKASAPDKASVSNTSSSAEAASAATDKRAASPLPFWRRLSAGIAAAMVAAVALLLCFALDLGPLPSIIIVLFAWITTAMSAQSVGQTGIDPMEIFGLIVLLVVAAFSDVSQVQLFFVAGVIAVACGLTGDLMNDFKAGHRLGTNPRAQWVGQLIGGVLGALVAVAVLVILVQAYGTEAFGLGKDFVSAQATMVATAIAGIPSIPAFVIGLALGFALHLLRLPSMMVGLGVYLPFYLSFTAFLGLIVKLVYNAICKHRRKGLSAEEAQARARAQDETGVILSSGLLGGESIAGVIVALAAIALFLGST